MKTAIVMTTYYPNSDLGKRRLENAKKVVHSLNFLMPLPLLIISDDDSKLEITELLCEYRGRALVVRGENQGVGASINRSLLLLTKEFHINDDSWSWIYMPDDFLLLKPDLFNLNQAIKIIEKYDYDFVRLNLPHPNLKCMTMFEASIGWWLDLDTTGPGFVFATRPTLISHKLHEKIGLFQEQTDAYETEKDYSLRVGQNAAFIKGALISNLGESWLHLSSEEDEVGRLSSW